MTPALSAPNASQRRAAPLNENLPHRWMKPVAVLLWLLTAGMVLSSIWLFFVQPWYLRRMAVAELKRHGEIEISQDDDSVTFILNDGEKDRETVTDLAVLLNRVRCTDLSLNGCENLKDIQCLEQVESLRYLDLRRTGVSDVGPLAALTNLQWLDLTVTGVSDVGPLAALTNLRRLDLDGTGVSDVGPLAALTKLQRLFLDGTGVSDVGPLAALTNLQELSLRDTGVSDVGPLAALTKLQRLFIDGTGVSDVGPLAALTNLQELFLNATNVPMEQVEALRKKLPECHICR